MLRVILGHVKEYKKSTLLTIFFAALEACIDIFIPYTMAAFIDKGIGIGSVEGIALYGAIMLILALGGLFTGILSGRYAATASAGFAYNLRDALYTHIQTFSFSNIDKFSTAGLVTRLTTDVTNIQNAFMMVIRMCVRSPIMLISSVVMTVIISPKMSTIFAVAIVVLVAILGLLVKLAMKRFSSVFEKYDALNASVQENIAGIRVVKAFVREEHENTKFETAAYNIYRKFVSAESVVVNNGPVMMLSVYGCMLALSWFGAHLIVNRELTTGELTSLFSYVMSILMSLMMLSMAFVMLSMSVASGERISEVLKEESDIVSPGNPLMEVKDGSIVFEKVNFSYKKDSKKPVLSDINLQIKEGETIGIIGGTGSAKSSLVNLISRLYDVSDGCVRVGGADVREYDVEVLRNQVAVVLQKNVLFSGTILENLRWGNENATKQECIEACKIACAHEFIETFPEGYDTYIEQGGSNVSGGQRQRLCIARALLKKPKVLILDDSTSAVDTATDARIRKAFSEKASGVTKLIIAQRISSVQDADRILVLEDGEVNGFDTHEKLLATNTIYREVYESQTRAGGDFDEVEGGDK